MLEKVRHARRPCHKDVNLSVLPHYGWKEFCRENKQGVEGSGNEHFTQGAKRHSTCNVT